MVHIEANGGQWVRPAEALFLSASPRAQPELLEALLREGIPVTDQGMPAELLQACLQHIPGARQLRPGAVRAQLGSRPLMATSLSASERIQVCCPSSAAGSGGSGHWIYHSGSFLSHCLHRSTRNMGLKRSVS